MWTVSSCTAANNCFICGPVQFAVGQQPEGMVCDTSRGVPTGRFITIAHVMEFSYANGQQIGGGGSSGGTVVTICEAKVFGTRQAFGTGQYLNAEGTCQMYTGTVAQPPPPPPACASKRE